MFLIVVHSHSAAEGRLVAPGREALFVPGVQDRALSGNGGVNT